MPKLLLFGWRGKLYSSHTFALGRDVMMQCSPCTGGTSTTLSIEEGCEVNGLVFQSWLCCWLATPVSSSSPCPRNLFFKPVNQGISQDTSLQTTRQKILGVLVFGRVQIMLQVITWGVKVLVQAKAGSPFALYSGLCPSHSCAQWFVALGRGDCFELCPASPLSQELMEQQFQWSL